MSHQVGGGGRCQDCEKLRVLEAEVIHLREENRLLKERLDSLESSAVQKGWYKPSIKSIEERKKPGRREGHVGAGRHKPDHVDGVIPKTLQTCPDCGIKLGDSYDFRSRYIWDVPPPSLVKVTEYQIHRYWCPCCRRSVEAQSDLLPYFRLGIGVWGWAYVMHHQLNVSHDKIVWWMREVWHLPVTKGALTQGLDSLAKHLKPIYDGMVDDLRKSPYCHVDETGCRVNGVNWWTWGYRTEDLILYQTEHSRGSQVPEETLGENYPGGIVSDDYRGYSPLKCLKQADWVHLIRKARDLTETKKAHQEHRRLYHHLQRIYHDIKQYLVTPPPNTERPKHYHRFERRLKRIIRKRYETKGAKQVAERINRRLPEYLTCIMHPEIPPQNNPAEQALRRQVIHRKNSSIRSETSAKTHDLLNSLLATQLQTTPNPLEATHQILTKITTEN